jgi:hypothetical protein
MNTHASDEVHAADGVEPRRTGRRGLMAGAVAAAAMLALEHGEASASDGGNLVIGVSTNVATSETKLTTSTGQNGLHLVNNAGYGFGLLAEASAYGVQGTANGYAGVFGDTSGTTSAGVVGLSRSTVGSGPGVTGGAASPNAAGVIGNSTGGYGVIGRADALFNDLPPGPIGVHGRASIDGGLGGSFIGTRAATSTSAAPTTGAHAIGDIVVGSTGRVFVCVAAGTPGTWNELGAPRLTLQLLATPERFIDTRDGTGGVKGPISSGTTRTFTLTGQNGLSGNPALQVPNNATGFIGNLTAIGASDAPLSAFISLWPSGPRPTISNVNYGPGNTLGAVANAVTVGLADTAGGHRGVQIFNYWTCDYLLDVTGYYIVA